MGRHRENIDIVADILKNANEGNGKTKIMSKANLSYTLLCKYLDLTCCCDLLNNNDSKKYQLTSKGIKFLSKYNSYIHKRNEITESLIDLNSERRILEDLLEPIRFQ
jgi:predicted transcriptional regulator